MMKYYAKVVREGEERLLVLESESLNQARREAVEYLSGFQEREARLELYTRHPGSPIPELLWCRMS
jgi:hypothetical protein